MMLKRRSILYFSLISLMSLRLCTNAIWFEVEEEEVKLGDIATIATGTNEAIKPLSANSQIECVLRCTNKCKLKAFYANTENQCFCLENNNGVSKIEEENQNKLGKLLKEAEPQSK